MTGSADMKRLAAIWVERWLAYGGGLVANTETGGLSISMRMDQWRWKHGEVRQRLWHDGWMTGRWRELQELMELIPGLREAMVDHVADHGEDYGPDCRTMYRPGPHVRWQAAAAQTSP